MIAGPPTLLDKNSVTKSLCFLLNKKKLQLSLIEENANLSDIPGTEMMWYTEQEV